jgi:hypothetical protein
MLEQVELLPYDSYIAMISGTKMKKQKIRHVCRGAMIVQNVINTC